MLPFQLCEYGTDPWDEIDKQVAFTAWAQWRNARRLTRKMDDILKNQSESLVSEVAHGLEVHIELESTTTKPRLHLKDGKWSSVHSFYAGMGGFIVDITELPEDKRFFPGSRKELTLAPETVLFLAEHEPSILNVPSEAELRDKSKASGLGKAIVCLQATWFLTQFISRLSQGLSASLLELNTAAHAICALLVYLLWWDKPLDVEEPTRIAGNDLKGLFALLCFYSNTLILVPDFRDCYQFLLKEKLSSSEAHSLDLETGSSGLEEQSLNQRFRQIEDSTSGDSPLEPNHRSGSPLATSQPHTFRIRDGEAIGRFTFHAIENSPYTRQGEFTLYTLQDRNRWRLVSDSWDEYAGARSVLCQVTPLRRRMNNWPTIDSGGVLLRPIRLSRRGVLLDSFFIAFTIAGFLYGAIHLLAWEGPFHSHIECLLWRISGILIAASGLVILGQSAFSTLFDIIYKSYSTVIGSTLETFGLGLVLILLPSLIILLVFYLLARTYLIIACFLTLPYLPDSAFQQPQWSTYFPHIN